MFLIPLIILLGFFIPQTFMEWIFLIALIIGIILAIAKREVDKHQDKLIKLLREELAVLEKAMADQEKRLQKDSDRLNKTLIENDLMQKILTERDKRAYRYRAKVQEAINKGEESNVIIKEVNQNLNELIKVLKDFIENQLN